MEADGEPIPAPSSLDTVRRVRQHRDAVPFLVEVEPETKIQQTARWSRKARAT